MLTRLPSIILGFTMLTLPIFVGAAAAQICDAQIPLAPGLRVEHGVVDSQIGIDFKKKGPARFERRDRARLIEIERIWGNGGKTIFPEGTPRGKLVGAHFAFYLKSSEVSGVGLWSMSFDGKDLFAVGEWLLDSVPIGIASPLEISRGKEPRWRTLTVLLPEGLALPARPSLRFYARTLFHRPWLPKNLATGSRVDACAYFLFAD